MHVDYRFTHSMAYKTATVAYALRYSLSFIPAAYLCHGLMQLDTLVELDIGGNQIPEAFQSLLQVSLALLSSPMLVYYNLQLTHAA